MGKRAGLLYTGLVAAMGGIGWLKGNSIYRQLFLPRQDEEGEDNRQLPEKKWIRDGRAWLLSQAERKDIYTDSIDHLKLHAFLLSPPEEEGHDVAVVVHAEHSCAEETGIYARHYLEERSESKNCSSWTFIRGSRLPSCGGRASAFQRHCCYFGFFLYVFKRRMCAFDSSCNQVGFLTDGSTFVLFPCGGSFSCRL